jgi:hypothetical protein
MIKVKLLESAEECHACCVQVNFAGFLVSTAAIKSSNDGHLKPGRYPVLAWFE